MIRVLFVSGCWKLSSELLCCWSWFKLVGSATRLLVITWYWLIDMEFVVCYGCLFCLSASFDCSASSYFHSDLVFRCLRFTKWRSRGGGGGGNKEGGAEGEGEGKEKWPRQLSNLKWFINRRIHVMRFRRYLSRVLCSCMCFCVCLFRAAVWLVEAIWFEWMLLIWHDCIKIN